MEIPDYMHPLYSLVGQVTINKCRECGCEIHHSNESDEPDYCIDCKVLEKIMIKVNHKRERFKLLRTQ